MLETLKVCLKITEYAFFLSKFLGPILLEKNMLLDLLGYVI